MPREVVQQFLPGIAGSTNHRRAYGLQLEPFFFRFRERTERISVC
jgi:hypothetical protein